MYRGTLAMVGTALAAGVLVAAPLAMASNGADDGTGASGGGGNAAAVRVSGTCTDGSTAKLKIKPDNGRVEVEFEVDENRNGSRWGVTLKRNGTRVVSRSALTRAPSGSFSVNARIAAGSPRTKVVAVARRAATGEVCRATATL